MRFTSTQTFHFSQNAQRSRLLNTFPLTVRSCHVMHVEPYTTRMMPFELPRSSCRAFIADLSMICCHPSLLALLSRLWARLTSRSV